MKKRIVVILTGLCVSVCFFTSCSKDNITEEINSVETQVSSSKIETIDSIGVVQTHIRLEGILTNLKLNIPRLKAGSPIYVGVLSNDRTCGTYSNVYGVIEYGEDLEDNKPRSGYNNNTGSLNISGMQFDSHKNATWYVCIVDGANFVKLNKPYAVFALSPQQFLNQSNHVNLSTDDEDVATRYDSNSNHYISPTLGFMPSNGGLPVQPGSYSNRKESYTNFQLYYFEKNSSSSAKLPNLGFNYSVFGNFGDTTKQNSFYFDLEDSNCDSGWSIYYCDGTRPQRTSDGPLDPNADLIYLAGNVTWYIQSSVGNTY